MMRHFISLILPFLSLPFPSERTAKSTRWDNKVGDVTSRAAGAASCWQDPSLASHKIPLTSLPLLQNYTFSPSFSKLHFHAKSTFTTHALEKPQAGRGGADVVFCFYPLSLILHSTSNSKRRARRHQHQHTVWCSSPFRIKEHYLLLCPRKMQKCILINSLTFVTN